MDAEQTWYQGAIDQISMILALKLNKKSPIVFNTYQLYLKDCFDRLKYDHEFLKSKNLNCGAKLVRGAYITGETKRSKEKKLEYPINDGIKVTNENYNKGVTYVLDNIDTMGLFIASHNLETSIVATNIMKSKNIPNNSDRVQFGQLFGMADYISSGLANEGYNVSKYLCYGSLEEIMPYLVRRLEENSSVLGGSMEDIKRLKEELKRRKNN
jgi:proline dehydrogenase